MRKTTITLLSFAAALFTFANQANAQTAYDAFSYTRQDYEGTARSVAMGNAFTALGGDLGGISINPAGSGVYRYSEASFTFGLSSSSATGRGVSGNAFGDPGRSVTQNRFTMPNFGALLYFDTYRDRGIKAVNVGIYYSKTQDYNLSFSAGGINSLTSWAGSLAAGSTGISSDQLRDENAYFNGMPWSTVAGWDSGIISNFGNAPKDQYAAITENIRQTADGYEISLGGPLSQKAAYRTFGSKNDLVVNVGANISDIVYAGINLGFITMDYNRESRISEYAVNSSDFETGFVSLSDRNRLSASGRGVYAKFGVIVTPVAGLRIGGAIQTPTSILINESFIEDMNVTTTSGSGSASTPEGVWSYRMNTPLRYNVGAAYVFNSFGLISFDYEAINYGSMRFKDLDGYYDSFDATNSEIASTYGVSHTFRAGLEINPCRWLAVRGGFNLITAPEKNIDANSYIYSAGLGFKSTGSFYADIAVRYKQNSDLFYSPYMSYIDNVDDPVIKVKSSLLSVIATIGFRF